VMDDLKKNSGLDALHTKQQQVTWGSHACDREDYVFCDVTTPTLEDSYHFRCTGCLHLQGRKVSQAWAKWHKEMEEHDNGPFKGPYSLHCSPYSYHLIQFSGFSPVFHFLHAFTIGLWSQKVSPKHWYQHHIPDDSNFHSSQNVHFTQQTIG
jgi:hypothetical protein